MKDQGNPNLNCDEINMDRKVLVGKNIRKHRVEKNLSLDELSRFIKITPGFLGLVERCERGMTLDKLVIVANLLEVPLDCLVKNEKKRQSPTNPVYEKINFYIGTLTQEEQERLLNIIRLVFPMP